MENVVQDINIGVKNVDIANNVDIDSGLNVDIDIERERFAIQSSILRMKLEQMIDRTKVLEKKLINGMNSRNQEDLVSTTEFYTPDRSFMMPPKKRAKL
jgi:hypothetical protein